MTWRATGKAILCGEHFVVHGAPAIALPLPGLVLELARSSTSDARRPTPDARLVGAWSRAREALGLAPARDFPFDIRSTIPQGAGLGSSAALSVARGGAAADEAGASLLPAEVVAAATRVELAFHGRSSGLDPAVVALGTPIFWRGSGGFESVTIDLTGHAILVATVPGSRPTGDAVSRFAAFARDHASRFAGMRAEVTRLVREARSLLAGPDPAGRAGKLGGLLDRNHALLAEAGVSTPALDALAAASRRAGACGSKLSGAGLGGAVIALVPDGGVNDVLDAMRREGATSAGTSRS